MSAYFYRASAQDPLVAYFPEKHGYPCDYIGGDEGPVIVTEEYLLVRNLRERAVFLHGPTGAYYAAVRIGQLTNSPIGDDWRQGQAHIVLGTDAMKAGGLTALVGPFSFYDILFALEHGSVSPREAIADGYFGEAVTSMPGMCVLFPVPPWRRR